MLKIVRPTTKSFYDIHDPIGLHYLFQLRTELSPLRSHKFRHNFRDTPTDNCICGQGIEDNKHFLFECLHFVIQRVDLAVVITTIYFIETTLSELQTTLNFIFMATLISILLTTNTFCRQQYNIKNTQRFSQ